MELLVVLTILVATATMVLPMLKTEIETGDGQQATASEVTTRSTMNVLRDVIAGEEGVMDNLAHSPDAMPREVSELVAEEAPSHVQVRSPELARFNALYGIGWRGPYIQATGKNEEGEPTIIDGWGREIELQIDFDEDGEVNSTESRYIRLVSAGPNGKIDTPADMANMQPGKVEGQSLTMSDCGDDLVMFLCVPDDRQ